MTVEPGPVGLLTGLPLSKFATAEMIAKARAAGFDSLWQYVEHLERRVGLGPPGLVGDGETRALLAVLAGARTTNAVAAACGWTSRSSAWVNLIRLRERGLVAWEPGRSGTLRPLVRTVEVRRDVIE